MEDASTGWLRREIVTTFLAALSIRGVLALVLGRVSPIADDQAHYFSLAATLRSTHAYQDPATGLATAFRDPLYPWLIAAIGQSRAALWAWQALLSAATGAFLIATAASAGARVARITSILFLLQLSFATYTFLAYAETLTTFALALSLWSVSRVRASGSRAFALLAAISGASALLARLAALLVGAGAWLAASRGSRVNARVLAVAALLALLPTGMWCVRNQARVGLLTPNTNGALNFYFGNNARTPLVHSFRAITDSVEWAPLVALSEPQRVHEAWRLAWAFIVEHPARAALGAVAKIPDALEPDRMFLGVSRRGQFPQRSARTLLLLGVALTLVTLIPTTLSLACALRPPDHWLARAGQWALAAAVITQMLTFAAPRFTLSAWILALPGAALTVERWQQGDRQVRGAVIIAGALMMILLIRQWRLG